MPVLMFQHRFAPKVEDGSKPHTIRPNRKRPIKVGDHLSLRKWEDKPYRSKQIVLRESECISARPILITSNFVEVDNGFEFFHWGTEETLNKLAVHDGFNNWEEMKEWFINTHNLPFRGVLIEWNPAPAENKEE